MENFYHTTKIRKPRKTPKRERYHKLPYDPLLASDSIERFAIPKGWYIRPNASSDSQLHLPSELLRLLKTPKAPLTRGASNTDKLQHLFARASFGLTVPEIQLLSLSPPEQAVDTLLAETEIPSPPGQWITEPFDFAAYRKLSPQEQRTFLQLNRERFEALRKWWFELMMGAAFNLREKMTLFWHGHFTSDFEAAALAQIMFKQNDTWRRHALGNFRMFLKKMYKDPAMLLYLNGVQNVAEAPNENFARELMELFTMGVGHYSENDIKEAARAFTGWQIDTINWLPFLYSPAHDYGTKTFLGQTGNFDGDDIIDIILEQEVTAHFVCRKLYEFFVSRELDDGFIADLANTFRSNDYEIKPVLQQIFTSDVFYSDHAAASLIKTPLDLAISNARMLSIESANVFFLVYATAALDQELLNPPNVAGWPGQRSWINPTTYVLRNTVSEIFVNENLFRDRETNEPPIRFDPLAFGHSFALSGARQLAEAMTQHLLRMPISAETLDFLVDVLVGTADPNDWSLEYPGADRQVREFLIQVLRLPEFHLS